MMTDFVYLNDADLEALAISPTDVADAVEAAILDKAAGALMDAPKSVILPGEARYMMSTLAVGNRQDLTVVKQVSVCPENPAKGLATTNGAIIVLDARTGLLRALMGANWVTGTRTAALSAVAARRLANPKSASVAFVGCGLQAHTHLDAFSAMFPLTEIRAFGRGQANIDRLCKKADGMGLKATVSDSAEAAIRGADLVVTSITLDYSVAPFLDGRWMEPGAFAAITDLGIPWKAKGMGAFGQVVIDDRAQEATMEKKLVAPSLVTADLGDVVSGAIKVGFDPERPSAFAFRGIALGDYAAAALALARAEAKGAGKRLPL